MSPEEKQVVDRLKETNNILVTVKTDPTIDQLAACLGLTLALNKAGKHATAVFSGKVPSAIEFLEPEKTLEATTDSLRDFIISLDKAKADKLRYKVEDNVVKIFITPYKTAITSDDFEYSQGDFNVEAVVALGVHAQSDLDIAITSHGRILHDATVITINTEPGADLGTLAITDQKASSLSEVVTILLQNFDKEVFDEQIATALLTGVVSETERFSNEKTTPTTMSVSSILMTAGANQKLVATKLEEPKVPEVAAESVLENQDEPVSEVEAEDKNEEPEAPTEEAPAKPKEPGVLEIDHAQDEPIIEAPEAEQEPGEVDDTAGQITVDEEGHIQPLGSQPEESASDNSELELPPLPPPSKNTSRMILQPPTMGNGQFTASTTPESDVQGSDIALPAVEEPVANSLQKPFSLSDALAENDEPIAAEASVGPETLADIERSVGSSHIEQEPQLEEPVLEKASDAEVQESVANLDDARKAVEAAMAATPVENRPLDPVQALNAEVVDFSQPEAPASDVAPALEPLVQPQVENTFTMPQPQNPVMPQQDGGFALPSLDQNQPQPVFAQPQPTVVNPNAAPPVPPPMMPPSFGNPQQ